MSDSKNWLLVAGPSGYTDPTSGVSFPADVVVNQIVWDGLTFYQPPAGLLLAPADGRQIWSAPTQVVVPATVAMWQLKTVLLGMPSKILGAGHTLLDDANGLAAQVGSAAQLAWNGAASVDRSSPTLEALAPQLGLTPTDIDQAFVAAAAVRM